VLSAALYLIAKIFGKKNKKMPLKRTISENTTEC